MSELTCPNDDTILLEDLDYDFPLPKFMKTPTDELFQKEIDERNEWASYVNSNFPDLGTTLKTILEKIESENPGVTMGWLGGSRAWEYNFESKQDLDPISKASIVAGNYDMFIIYNDFQTLNDDYSKLSNKLKTVLLPSLNDNKKRQNIMFELISDRRPRKKLVDSKYVLNTMLDRCTISNCYSFLIMLSDKGYEDKGYEDKGYEDKLLVYIEMGLNNYVNIPDFKNKFINNDFILNPDGLYILSSLILYNRRDKGINVDYYRQQLLNRYLLENMKPTDNEETLQRKRITVLEQTLDPNDRLNNIIKRQIMSQYFKTHFNNLFKTHFNDTRTDMFEHYIYEVLNELRPYIYSYIIYTSDMLKKLYPKILKTKTKPPPIMQKKYQLFLAGGDAIQRYLNLSSTDDHFLLKRIKTNDFDVKLLYVDDIINEQSITNKDSTPKETTFYNKLIEHVEKCMILYTTHLEQSCYIDDKATYDIISNDKYTLKIPKLQLMNDIPHDVTAAKTQNLFRLRLIKKSDAFPVDLYTIDLRIPFKIVNQENNIIHGDNIDIPLFDFVLQKVEALPSTYFDSVGPLNFPIASKKYILSDLRNTYENEESAQQRSFNQKTEKDFNRYENIHSYRYVNDCVFYVNPTFFEDKIIQRIKKLIYEANNYNSYSVDNPDVYAALFSYTKTKMNRCGYDRSKLSFNIEKLKQSYETLPKSHKGKKTKWNSYLYDNSISNTTVTKSDSVGGKNDQDRSLSYGKKIASYLKSRDEAFFKKYSKDPKKFLNNIDELTLNTYLYDFILQDK